MARRIIGLAALVAVAGSAAGCAAGDALDDAGARPGLGVVAAPHPDAPEALGHFAPLIGSWAVRTWSRDETGALVEGAGADWDFAYALDGWAVQDVWRRSPDPAASDGDEMRLVGTNVRMWDPAAGRWKMTWITNGSGAPETWFARSTPDEIVMTLAPPATPRRRITFHDMTGETFDWRMEAEGEDGAWTEVFRIHGDRK